MKINNVNINLVYKNDNKLIFISGKTNCQTKQCNKLNFVFVRLYFLSVDDELLRLRLFGEGIVFILLGGTGLLIRTGDI